MTLPPQVPQITPEEAAELARSGALLLDVREPAEWAAGHVPGAVHRPLGALTPADVPDDRVIVAICRSGNRSGRAATALIAAGHDARNLAGGMQAWARDGRPVLRDDGSTGTVA